jgi:very-short-patch-repair endonuclease
VIGKAKDRRKPTTLANARALRRAQTPAEAKLWSRLRANQVHGLKFRRQQPIGPYIVDFYCSSRHLIIEVDGDTHIDRANYDEVRTQWLIEKGYRVVRFCNSDLHEDLDGVLEKIISYAEGQARFTALSPSPPAPLPLGGEGGSGGGLAMESRDSLPPGGGGLGRGGMASNMHARRRSASRLSTFRLVSLE